MNRSDKPEVQVRVAAASDAADMAALWSACEPASVWAKLGPRLSEIYFRRYCVGPHELALTASLNGVLVGACVGSDRPREYVRAFYAEHRGELAKAFALEFVSRPSIVLILLSRLARGMLVRLRVLLRAEGGPSEPLGAVQVGSDRWCYMSDFFVSPSARGRQLGTLMLESFCSEMALRGCDWCAVHTTIDNVASQVAQRRAGFQCVHEHATDLTFVRRLHR